MPQLGETVTEGLSPAGTRVGDAVAIDDVLFEVSTEKVDTEVPSAVAGVLRAVHVAEGETVPVGTPLAVITATADEPIDGAPAAAACGPTPGATAPPDQARLSRATSRSGGPQPARPTRPRRPWPRRLPVAGRANSARRTWALARRGRGSGGLDGRIRGTTSSPRPRTGRARPPLRRPEPCRRRPRCRRRTSRGRDRMTRSSSSPRLAGRRPSMVRSLATARASSPPRSTITTSIRSAAARSSATCRSSPGRRSTPSASSAISTPASATTSSSCTAASTWASPSTSASKRSSSPSSRTLATYAQCRAGRGDGCTGRQGPPQAAHRRRPERWDVHHHERRRYGTVVTAPVINQPQVAILSTDSVRMRPTTCASDAGSGLSLSIPSATCASASTTAPSTAPMPAAFLARARVPRDPRWEQEL